MILVLKLKTFVRLSNIKYLFNSFRPTTIMKHIVMVFSALVLSATSLPNEPTLTNSETFTQVYPFAQRAFLYYPVGSGGIFNRPVQQNPSSEDLIATPFTDEAKETTIQDMIRPAGYFVPASDVLSMPYPSADDQETEERAAMKHLEMLKDLHDQLENSEERFLMPSISMAGNAVTLSTTSFMSMLQKLSKTVTKTIVTTVVSMTTVTVFETGTTPAIIIPSETTATDTPTVTDTPSLVSEVLLSETVLPTVVETVMTMTTIVAPPLTTVTTITSTIF